LRENSGELEAARNGSLPRLVELRDLRGDLHTHTTWSDGKDSLEAMVARAVAKGYEYYAICDHSQRLRDGLLAEQSAAIDELQSQVSLRILKGVEVNIRANGSLDLADDELASFVTLGAELGLDCLVEVHDEAELARALDAGASLVGVKTRPVAGRSSADREGAETGAPRD
jgi:hypothetical protein